MIGKTILLYEITENSVQGDCNKEELPPVNAFWSLSMYKLPEQLFIENPINRYVIGQSFTFFVLRITRSLNRGKLRSKC